MTSIDRLEGSRLDCESRQRRIPGQRAGPGHNDPLRNERFFRRQSYRRGISPKPHLSEENKDSLNYLQVRFEQKIAGNLHEQKMTFFERVRTIYGPIPTWDIALDVDRPETWGPQDVVIHRKELSVTQVPTAVGKQRNVLMDAVGNVEVEGETVQRETFKGQGHI